MPLEIRYGFSHTRVLVLVSDGGKRVRAVGELCGRPYPLSVNMTIALGVTNRLRDEYGVLQKNVVHDDSILLAPKQSVKSP